MEDEFPKEDEDFLNKLDYDTVIQRACQEIDANNGSIKELKQGNAVVFLETSRRMVLDKNGLIHSGNLYSSAAYAALLAVNNPNAVVIGAEVKFLAPLEVGNEVVFKAQTLQEDTKKREVKVEGFVLDIKIFDAMFYVAVFEKHVLSLHITKEMEKKMG
ncbi:hypothetical protein [Helicobacter mesocricetorum]|uniref:hypothetical protein n=1 Tax=Helicobacter mesocricetorum TaxID=87012 RepID=UPI000CF012F7|nr:hypothetical protein [Helicobacter mesocricetorum]